MANAAGLAAASSLNAPNICMFGPKINVWRTFGKGVRRTGPAWPKAT